jgi:hypothetical protein
MPLEKIYLLPNPVMCCRDFQQSHAQRGLMYAIAELVELVKYYLLAGKNLQLSSTLIDTTEQQKLQKNQFEPQNYQP